METTNCMGNVAEQHPFIFQPKSQNLELLNANPFPKKTQTYHRVLKIVNSFITCMSLLYPTHIPTIQKNDTVTHIN